MRNTGKHATSAVAALCVLALSTGVVATAQAQETPDTSADIETTVTTDSDVATSDVPEISEPSASENGSSGETKTEASQGDGSSPVTEPEAAAEQPSEGAVEMQRLYNPSSGEHFYTANTIERDNLRRQGWAWEGIGWVAPAVSSTPVYRLYNPNAGDHHYTVLGAERDMLMRAGWRYEGVGWYSSDVNRSYPIYRQYNPHASTGTHNYTFNRIEADTLVRAGWRDEGIGWYGVGPGKSVPQEYFSRNVPWVRQGTNECATASGLMIFQAAGKIGSANGTPLSMTAMRNYMHFRWDGVPFYDILNGMDQWVGGPVFAAYESPTTAVTTAAVRHSYDTPYAPMVVTGERYGGPHLSGHPNSTFDHAMVIDNYNSYLGTVRLVDPLIPQRNTYSLQWLNDTFMQFSMANDHVGLIASK